MANRVIGAALAVHRALGPGFVESIYERALVLELEHRELPFERQLATQIEYRGVVVGQHRLDLVVDGRVIIELKATMAGLVTHHIAQAVTYLKATGLELALVINFAHPTLRAGVKRVVPSSAF